MQSKPPIIVITGQTATGKTSLALDLAKDHDGELVNADSRQTYRHLTVITGKDVPSDSQFTLHETLGRYAIGYHTLRDIPIWLYDVIDPSTVFSSHDYVTCAKLAIEDIHARGKTPIIIGGTYLYLKHLLYGFGTEGVSPDWEFREQMNTLTVEQLQEKLLTLSPTVFASLNNSDRHNPHRLIRKIEILSSGQTPNTCLPAGTARYEIPDTRYQIRNTKYQIPNTKYDLTSYIGLHFADKEKLVKKITLRVEERVKNGAVEEISNLLKTGYKKSDPGMRAIGAAQLVEYLGGKLSKKRVIDEWILREVQYAKRQYTFMKVDTQITWRDV